MTPTAAIRSAWAARSRRERILVAAAAVLAAACLAAAGGQALTRTRVAASDRLAAAAAENAAVTAGLERLRPSVPVHPRGASAEVETAARRQADDLGLEIALESEAGEAVFRAEGVSAIDLFRWLSILESANGIRASALSVERADGGLVAAEGRLAALADSRP